MANRLTEDIRITPSVVDRLIDLDPKVSTEVPKSRSQSLSDLKQSVRRDLEWLLNTRHNPDKVPEDLEEVNKSLAVYGIPDFTGLSSKSGEDRKNLTKSVEKALRVFEPRFMNLRVSLEESSSGIRGIRFRIQATLKVEPTPEPIVFDTTLEVTKGEFQVREA